MQRFITHEALAAGWFNLDHNGSASSNPWEAFLGNTLESLELLCHRMEADYLGLNPKMRKAYGAKDIVPHLSVN